MTRRKTKKKGPEGKSKIKGQAWQNRNYSGIHRRKAFVSPNGLGKETEKKEKAKEKTMGPNKGVRNEFYANVQTREKSKKFEELKGQTKGNGP